MVKPGDCPWQLQLSSYYYYYYLLLYLLCCIQDTASRVQVFENNGGRPPSSSRPSKVIDLGANRKCICNLLLVTNSNFERDVSPNVFDTGLLMHKSRRYTKNTNQNTSSIAVCDVVVLHNHTDGHKADDEWSQYEQEHWEHIQLASGLRSQRHHDTRSSIVAVSNVDVLDTWRQVSWCCCHRLLLLLLRSRRIHCYDVTTWNTTQHSSVTQCYTYTVYQCAKLFVSELCQISTNCENFRHKDGKDDKLMWGALIFHLI